MSDADVSWDEAYSRKSFLFGDTPTVCVREMVALLRPGSRVLELGCGDGRDTLFLLSHGFWVTAIDSSRVAIQRLKEAAESQGSADHLTPIHAHIPEGMPHTRFDAVVAVTLLDHLDDATQARVLTLIRAGVVEGGAVALEMFTDRDPGFTGGTSVSEFAPAVRSVATANYLARAFIDNWRIHSYSDRLEIDADHGPVHQHGLCSIVAIKDSRSGDAS